MHIFTVVVQKDLRGKGYGKELMKKSEDFARRFVSTHKLVSIVLENHVGITACYNAL